MPGLQHHNFLSHEKSLPIHLLSIFELLRWFLLDNHVHKGKRKRIVTTLSPKYPLWDPSQKSNVQEHGLLEYQKESLPTIQHILTVSISSTVEPIT